MPTHANRSSSALAALSVGEKATVLDALLAARPDLRQFAETHAVRLMSTADRTAVADSVASTLRDLDVEELNNHAGYQPGRGYVHPVEAAREDHDGCTVVSEPVVSEPDVSEPSLASSTATSSSIVPPEWSWRRPRSA